MKKLIFIFSMLLVCSISFAQEANTKTDAVEIVEGLNEKGEPIKGTQVDETENEKAATETADIEVLQEETGLVQSILSWIAKNWQVLLSGVLPFLWLVARLTPTEKDNDLLRILQSWLDILIPNFKKSGGTFAAYREKEKAPTLAYVKPRPECDEKDCCKSDGECTKEIK